MRTPQQILAAAAHTAGLSYVSKEEAAAGVPIPENQKTWLKTLKDAIASEEHVGDATDVLVGEATTDTLEQDETVAETAEAELQSA